MKHPQILVVNGPNLNLLGEREPEKYGQLSLAEIGRRLQEKALQKGYRLEWMQSNAEAEIVDAIANAKRQGVKIILINAAALTHTSIALRDALLATKTTFIELHLSNIYAREEFRHKSYLSDIAWGVISGFQDLSYELALQAAIVKLDKSD